MKQRRVGCTCSQREWAKRRGKERERQKKRNYTKKSSHRARMSFSIVLALPRLSRNPSSVPSDVSRPDACSPDFEIIFLLSLYYKFLIFFIFFFSNPNNTQLAGLISLARVRRALESGSNEMFVAGVSFFFFFNSLTPCLAVRRCGVIKRECHPRVATLSHSMIIQQDFLSGSILPRIMSSQ